ncbi:pentatricopeptide repeat-containing protein At4g38150-like [Telopea speciosissima]|uniref:pentatricopeptide repeat-containing protein At4g38150-like n=1 Tax=Telopea speciosissima TaxID=54955 RepID=UPI001CC6E8AF|nr:pentatricopeptide repeat-containing protein At4g38150-like [Telopea speciosissima]
MAASAAISRSFLRKFSACFSPYHSPARMFSTTTTRLIGLTSLRHQHHHHLPASLKLNTEIRARIHRSILMLNSTTGWRLFSSEANTNSTKTFAFSDSDDDDDVDAKRKTQKQAIDKSKLPPPYDPFSKKPVIEEPKDPKDLQEVFHKMRSEGLINNAIKMFDALSKDGLTHEAMELFAQIKDKGAMPDVVAHTAVVEAYANAGQSKEALKVYMRMLASGVKPNAYTYTVLIKGLAQDLKLVDAKKFLVEMMDKGMLPNAGTYTAVFEAFARAEKMEEGREFMEQIKAKGLIPDEKAVREHLSKRGQVFRSVMNMLFGK